MKKIVMMMMALFLTGSMVMAQPGQGGGFLDPQQMTERMVQQYSLNDTQKGKLLEVNKAYVKELQAMFSEFQPGEAPSADMIAKMTKSREAYSAKLKGIMTAKQFEAYTKDQANMMGGAPGGAR
ncbi:MAG: DUF4890 domain-containing protein [Prevotellaceae bacterium]|nr:DUF4890 domain-containing protein [Prevotellaceae bacterium]